MLAGLTRNSALDLNSLYNVKNLPYKKLKTGVLENRFIARLQSGSVFGEKGLDDKTTRSASIICESPCHFAWMGKDNYNKILKEIVRRVNEKNKTFFFETVFNGFIPKIFSNKIGFDFFKNKTFYKMGELVFKEGSDTNFVFVLLEGEISIFKRKKKSNSSLKKEKVIKKLLRAEKCFNSHRVAVITEGSFFGEFGLFWEKDRYFTAVATKNSEVLSVRKECLQGYFNVSSELKNFLYDTARQKFFNRNLILQREISFNKELKKKSRKESVFRSMGQEQLLKDSSNIVAQVFLSVEKRFSYNNQTDYESLLFYKNKFLGKKLREKDIMKLSNRGRSLWRAKVEDLARKKLKVEKQGRPKSTATTLPKKIEKINRLIHSADKRAHKTLSPTLKKVRTVKEIDRMREVEKKIKILDGKNEEKNLGEIYKKNFSIEKTKESLKAKSSINSSTKKRYKTPNSFSNEKNVYFKQKRLLTNSSWNMSYDRVHKNSKADFPDLRQKRITIFDIAEKNKKYPKEKTFIKKNLIEQPKILKQLIRSKLKEKRIMQKRKMSLSTSTANNDNIQSGDDNASAPDLETAIKINPIYKKNLEIGFLKRSAERGRRQRTRSQPGIETTLNSVGYKLLMKDCSLDNSLFEKNSSFVLENKKKAKIGNLVKSSKHNMFRKKPSRLINLLSYYK